MNERFIYFMRPIDADGPVKVGCSAIPADRLAYCQKCSPVPLEFAAVLAVAAPLASYERGAMQAVERRFHERYLPWHIYHEWFAFNPLIAADIEAIRAGTFDLDCLPQPTAATWRLPPATRRPNCHVTTPALAA